MELPENKGTILGGPHTAVCSILGSTLGYPYLWKLPFMPRVVVVWIGLPGCIGLNNTIQMILWS